MKELGATNLHREAYMYKRTLLMLLMALPLFATGANLTWNQAQSDRPIGTRSSSSSRNAAAQPLELPAPIMAARDRQGERQCSWLGTCSESE